jgi:hypothetical protein
MLVTEVVGGELRVYLRDSVNKSVSGIGSVKAGD